MEAILDISLPNVCTEHCALMEKQTPPTVFIQIERDATESRRSQPEAWLLDLVQFQLRSVSSVV